MIKLQNLIESQENRLHSFEEMSNELYKNEKNKTSHYLDSKNLSVISESSFYRLINFINNSNKEGCIISAFKIYDNNGNKLSHRENIRRSSLLKRKLNEHKLGAYQLIGRWQECTDPKYSYKNCPKDKLIETVERSFYIPKPDFMSSEEFLSIMLDLMTIDNIKQNAIIIKNKEGFFVYEDKNTFQKIADKMTLNNIGQAYSQFIKKQNVPFIFEGMEIPNDISGKKLYSHNKVLFL